MLETILTYLFACAPILTALATIMTAAFKLLKSFKNVKSGTEAELAEVKKELAATKNAYKALEAEVHKATVAMTHVEDRNIREE